MVAVTDVVQVVAPTASTVDELSTGATWATSGATVRSASAAASVVVKVVADPRPARTPALVVLPGVTTSRLVPRLLIWAWTACCAPCPSPTIKVTEAMPIQIPSTVSSDRIRWVRMASSAIRKVSVHLMV